MKTIPIQFFSRSIPFGGTSVLIFSDTELSENTKDLQLFIHFANSMPRFANFLPFFEFYALPRKILCHRQLSVIPVGNNSNNPRKVVDKKILYYKRVEHGHNSRLILIRHRVYFGHWNIWSQNREKIFILTIIGWIYVEGV